MTFRCLAAIMCFACIAISSPAQNSANPLESLLTANTKAIPEAQKTKDTATLKRLLADDFHYVGSEGMLHDRAEFIDDIADGHLQDYSLYQFQLLPVDDTAVIVSYKGVMHQTEGDDILAPRYQHFADLWVKQGDQWKLKFQQSTPRRPVD
jgi:hypothetical protein